jgi:hypothetical protein
MRLKLHAGRRRRQQAATVPVQIQFLMDMPAQQILRAWVVHQHVVQLGGITQTVLIESTTARRQRMMMQKQQSIAFRRIGEFTLQPFELKFA